MEKIRKKRLWLISTLMMALIFTFIPQNIINQTAQASGKVIVVNPGHMDGVDSGAVNSSLGIREVDVNNALAIKVVKTLRNAGYNAMLSHPIPNNPGLPTLLSSEPDYNVYSTTICKEADEIGADLLISIHHNSGTSSSSGAEFYWSSYHPSVDNEGIYQKYGLWSGGVSADLDSSPPLIATQSEELAILFNEYFQSLDYVPAKDRIIERDDAITRKPSIPSVLIEAGYLSNNSEALKMANDSNQQKMANQILAAINEWFDTIEPGDSDDKSPSYSITASVKDTKITVEVSGITTKDDIQVLHVPVWSESGGQDDLKWYTATKQSDGSYTLTIDTKDHKGDTGNYNIHCYGENSQGKMTFLGATEAKVGADVLKAESLNATVEGSLITVKVSGITAPAGIKKLLVPVWSENNGQDDLIWYEAEKQSDGNYQLEIDTKNHNEDLGEYQIHCYAVDNDGNYGFLGSKTVQVGTTMTTSSVTVDVSGLNITVKLSGIIAPNGLKQVLIPVWSENNGQDDLVWYTAEKQSNGNYQLEIDTKNHKSDLGEYNIHCYGVDDSGEYTLLAAKTAQVGTAMTAGAVSLESSGTDITLKLSGISAPNGLKTIYVPVWSEKNGQDDLIWYEAEKQSDGSYRLTIDIKNHNNDTGEYNVHCYGVDNDGKYQALAVKTVEVEKLSDELTASSVQATLLGKDMTVVIDGINAPNGLKAIYVPTWSEKNGQDDIVWYEAKKQSDGSYKLVVNIDEHNGDSGMFQFHAYGVENGGNYVFLGSDSLDMPEFILIEGSPLVTVDQLVEYYEDSGKKFPQTYIDRGVDLEEFAQMYYDEAVTEGIRPEVAFAQMLIETGYLQYGGQVKVTQFNFAGLGAVDGGASGFDFSKVYGDDKTGIQMGIRAHIQHLKCYASTENLKNDIVDPRWNEKLRGKAIYLYWLSIPNNPYGTGWASDPNYGIKIQNKIESIMD